MDPSGGFTNSSSGGESMKLLLGYICCLVRFLVVAYFVVFAPVFNALAYYAE